MSTQDNDKKDFILLDSELKTLMLSSFYDEKH